jgi:hypothetical protein
VRRWIALGAAAVLASLVVAGPASAARPGFIIAPAAFPGDVTSARALLVQSRSGLPAGSLARRDIDDDLRLGARMMTMRQPAGRRATAAMTLRVNAWWYARGRGSPSSRVIARLPNGILATYWGGRGFAINPVATAGRWQDLNAHYSPEALATALLPLGVRRNAGRTRFLLWEYYDVPDKPGTIRPGASGMAQGRLAQLMARAYHRTGDHRFAEAARGALASFRVPVSRGGVVSEVADPAGVPKMPWYVERAYPGANPWKGAALNGFMVTLLNLHATAPLLRARPEFRGGSPNETRTRPRAAGAEEAGDFALDLMRTGEQTLARYLPVHDTGTWSLYGLLTPGRPWKSYLADEGYHCYHVTLLRSLAKISPDMGFAAVADRWSDYALRVGVRCEPGSLPPPSQPPPGALGGPGVSASRG